MNKNYIKLIAKLGSDALASPFDEAKAIVSDKFCKMSISLLFLSIFSLSSLEARNFKIFIEENGVDSNFPFTITDDFILEVGYYSNRDDSIENFTLTDKEGKKANKVDESNIFASLKYNLLKIENTNLFLGVEYEKFKRDNEQIGYYESHSNQVPYNNSVKLDGTKFNILSEVVYSKSKYRAFFRATITPKTTLDFKQNTKIFPNAIEGGEYKGSTDLDLSYKIESELKVDTGKYFDVAIGGSYGFVPYEYTYKALNSSRDGYIEKEQSYDEKTTEYFLKVRVKNLFSESMIPTIGYKKIKVKNSKMNDTDRSFAFVGVEQWF